MTSLTMSSDHGGTRSSANARRRIGCHLALCAAAVFLLGISHAAQAQYLQPMRLDGAWSGSDDRFFDFRRAVIWPDKVDQSGNRIRLGDSGGYVVRNVVTGVTRDYGSGRVCLAADCF